MTPGLILFVAVLVVDALTLGFDALLKWGLRVPTISARVWSDPVLGVPLVLWQLAGALGLFLHLYLKE